MFKEDLTNFFNCDEFSDQFVIQKNGSIFEGTFDKDYVDTNDISGMSPVINCSSDTVKSLDRGDVIEHGKQLYRFIYEEPDGTGVSRLILEVKDA